jgi:hypothetical protein
MSARIVVAPRRRECKVCSLSPEEVALVNAAIWPEPGVAVRGRNYRADAVRAAAAQGLVVDPKTVSRHSAHVEASWHVATPKKPAAAGEVAVFPTDYQSVASRMSGLGMAAADRIEERIPEMDDRDLVAVAKLGQTAAAQRESLRLRQQEGERATGLLEALFGSAAGLLDEGDIPESEVIDVTPAPSVREMLDEVRAERTALKRLQQGEFVDA